MSNLKKIMRDVGRTGVTSVVQGVDYFLHRPYRKIYLVSDNAQWVLDWEIKAYARTLESLGLPYKRTNISPYHQCVYFSDMFMALREEKLRNKNRIGVDFFHGNPKTSDEFIPLINSLKKYKDRLNVLRISHSGMREVVIDAGMKEDRIFQIPIGIQLEWFPFKDLALKTEMRKSLGISLEAFVVGSFQKDGVGWGEGLDPKYVKGPDIFVETMKILRTKLPNLHVLLTGSTRGYVKTNLEKLKIPYTHRMIDHYPDIGKYFQALDAYCISSREEGGPKAILESMASGVPLVTTRVGQAIDLVKHGENAFMVNSEDSEGLAHWLSEIAAAKIPSAMIANGIETARRNTYEAHRPQYKKLFTTLLEGR